MLSQIISRMSVLMVGIVLIVVALLASAGLLHLHREAASVTSSEPSAVSPLPLMDARAVVVIPHAGTEPLDIQIRGLQKQIAASAEPDRLFERLGGLFIAKARLTNDPGY